MAKGEKYIALTSFLEKNSAEIVKLTFKDIERIIGEKLPESAYKYPALWANSESHTIAFEWLNAGYISQNVNILDHTIEFVKSV